MSSKQIQLEIFERGHKNKKAATADGYPYEKSLEFKFPTQLCLKVACSIIIIVTSFTLGVERGKIISKNKISNSYLAEFQTKNIAKDATVKTKEIPLKNEIIKKPVDFPKKIEKEEQNDKIEVSKYVIQVVTYKKNSSYIEKEIAKLKQNGYTTLTIPSGNYIQICAGKFTDEKDAREHLRKLKQTYKDCSIRKI